MRRESRGKNLQKPSAVRLLTSHPAEIFFALRLRGRASSQARTNLALESYKNLTSSLQRYSAACISQQFIETEARQGRLDQVKFAGKPIAKLGYFVTPDGRENIFMQGISLLDHDVLFRSWHYLALRSDALAALAGAAGLVASLSRVDGAVLLQDGLDVGGFGVEIRTKADVKRVYLAEDESATKLVAADPRAYGTRHRSMMRYCQAHSSAVGIVVSQDGDIRAIATVSS